MVCGLWDRAWEWGGQSGRDCNCVRGSWEWSGQNRASGRGSSSWFVVVDRELWFGVRNCYCEVIVGRGSWLWFMIVILSVEMGVSRGL